MADACAVTVGCGGQIVDGFCDLCGMAPPVGAGTAVAPAAAPTPTNGDPGSSTTPATTNDQSQPSQPSYGSAVGSQRTGSQRTGSTQLSGKASRASRRSTSHRSSSRRRLGLGLVTVPELPKADPLEHLMK